MNNNTKLINNLSRIYGKIETAANKFGRKAEDIKILAVTKTIDTAVIKQLLDKNIKDFAENKVQELLKKYDILNVDCNWHFIGRLQTNKVKYIVDKVSLIHSIDRIELLEEIDKKAGLIGKCIDVLVQVNISKEKSKAGILEDDIYNFLTTASKYRHVSIRGLMTMAPHVQDPQECRWIFSKTNKLAIDIKMKKIDNVNMDFLSMGMSNDFEVAIEEGANIVRLGSAIFE